MPDSPYGSSALGPGSAFRFASHRGAVTTKAATYYPNPFFDIAQTYMPTTTKRLFEWCRYYAMTNPLISAVIYKMSAYPITDVVYETDNDGLREKYRSLFEDQFKIRSFIIDSNLDRATYGNSFVSVSFPFTKYLTCSECKEQSSIKRVTYRFRDLKFHFLCPSCKHNGPAKRVRDRYVKSMKGIKLIRWNPEHVSIRYNEVTGDRIYFYQIPRHLRNDILVGRAATIETIPQAFIESLQKKKAVVIHPDHIFHSRRPSISRQDGGWGVPMVLPVLKDVFYLQVLKKAQEAIFMGYITPMRVIYPAPGAGSGQDPYSYINLGEWRDNIQDEIQEHRRDSLYMPVFPVPIGYQNIGGEGKALMLSQEIRVWSEHIVAGMGVPPEMVFCMAGGTYVHTDRGMERISEVVERGAGPTILTHEGPKKITKVWRAGAKASMRVGTRLGLEVVGAETHPVLALKPDLSLKWTRFQDLDVGDYLVATVGSDVWPEEPPHLPKPVEKDRREKLIACPEQLTDDFARFLGYMASEGHINEEKINFANTDFEVFEDFLRCFKSCFGFEPNWAERTPRDGKPYRVVDVWRTSLCRLLEECGAGGNSYTKTVPTSILAAPRRYVSEFLRGYFEGDGGVGFKDNGGGSVQCISASEELLIQIQLLLLRLGVLSSRYRSTKAAPHYKLHIRGRSNLKVFGDGIGFVSRRKKDALAALLLVTKDRPHKIPFVRERLREFRDRHRIGNNNWQWDPFEFKSTQEVYTTLEVANVLDRSQDTVRWHIERGRLKASRSGPSGYYSILGEHLEEFCGEYGRGVLVPFPRLHKGATRNNIKDVPLGWVFEKEPELAKRIKVLADSDFHFDKILSIEEIGPQEMFDLTVDDSHCYIANGVVSHNSGLSWSGSNVSLRMLENEFLGNREDNIALLRFISTKIAHWLRWLPIEMSFKPFKMADDLQRSAFDLQLVQNKLLSKQTLLEDRDHDFILESERVRKELDAELEISRVQNEHSAETQGKAQVIQTKYQVKAQQIMQEAGMLAQPGQEGQPQQGQPMEGQPQQGQPMEGQSQGGPPTLQAVGENGIVRQLQSPLSGGGMSQELDSMAQSMASQIQNLNEFEQGKALSQLKVQSPDLYAKVLQLLNPIEQGQPLPEKLPPRRGPATAQI